MVTVHAKKKKMPPCVPYYPTYVLKETFLFHQKSKISDPHLLLKSAWSKANASFHSSVLIPNHENPWRIKNYRFRYELPLSPLKVIKEFTEASLYEAIKYCYGHNSFSEWSPHQTSCQNLTLTISYPKRRRERIYPNQPEFLSTSYIHEVFSLQP